MINAVIIDLPLSGRSTVKAFREACWALDVEPEHVDVTSYDCRANGVNVVPTIRVYADDDPYGDVLAEHRGAATGEQITALLERGQALV
ncbi:gp19 [Streptomyces phage phiBT1]|uniref:Gp19 n=1 Tax=Lomovskayavirus BT1 TaxID=225588 RepID=Q858Y4_9CAUD|nr:gp19 [Streptomyces phage phiBT1]CAD80141.1 gp19 [Lomovskayavirus BT1]